MWRVDFISFRMHYTPPPYTSPPSEEVRRQCRMIVLRRAAWYGVPPAHVTGHVRTGPAARARKEAMCEMLDMGLTRSQVALAFQRDLRRVRKSVLGR